jgi:serine/threonine-protein kinase RsbT
MAGSDKVVLKEFVRGSPDKIGGSEMSGKSTIDIITEWDIVAARQIGRNAAKEIGFGTVDQARITTAISELARNIYLYARAGEIVIEQIEEEDKRGISITATDKGPGIDDVRKVIEDGYSTSGGLGAGLPGVRRLMDHLEIQSSTGKGTIVKVEKWL